MKRFLALLLTLVIAASVMTACGTSKKDEPVTNGQSAEGDKKAESATKEKVELRYARWGLPEEMNGTKKMLDAFMQQNSNITVKLENSSWEEYWQKLQTQIASNSAPDVFLLDGGWYLGQFAPKGILKEIDPLMQKDNIGKDQYYNVWKTFSYNNKVYAMPRDYNSLVLFYNKDLFKKAGITEYPNADMTWEQVAQLAQKLTLDKNGKTPNDPGFDEKNIDQYGIHVNTPDTDAAIETMIWQNGGRLMSEDGKECYIDSDAGKKTLQFLYDLAFKYKAKMTPAQASKLDQQWFQTGKFAMVYQGSWMFSTLSDATFDWDITVPPYFEKKIYCVQSVGNAILEKTKTPDVAWQLVKFLSGKDGQTIMANENDAIPVLKDVAENTYLKSESKPVNKKAVFDCAVESVPYIDFPNKGEVFEGIKAKIEPYFNKQKSLDEAVQDAKKEVARIQGKK